MIGIRAYGLYGLGGQALSSGMDDFAAKLAPLVDHVETHPFTSARSILNDIEAQGPRTRIILFGHSMGANRATWIASRAPRIHVLIGFDPTWCWPVYPIGPNVDRAICFYGRGWSVLGRGKLRAADGDSVRVTNIRTDLLHTEIDDDHDLHAVALKAVRDLSKEN